MAVAVSVLLTACGGGDDDDDAPRNRRGVTQHSVTEYPATTPGSGATAQSQDLLTGGLGRAGLGNATPPTYADPLAPTALELRCNALYSNYTGLPEIRSASRALT